MAALTLFLDFKIYSIIILFLVLFTHRIDAETANWYDMQSMKNLVRVAIDLAQSTYEVVDSVEFIRQNHLNTAPFEVGYLMFTTFEVYRKMVEKHNISLTMNKQLYKMEHLLYLEEIEHYYWELDHVTSMLHEVERKYDINSSIHSKYQEITSSEFYARAEAERVKQELMRKPTETIKKVRIRMKVMDRLKPTTKKVRPKRFPIDYGWDYPKPEVVKKGKK